MKRPDGYPAVRAPWSNPVNDALMSYGCTPLTPDQFGAPGDVGQRIITVLGHAKRGPGSAELTLKVNNVAVRDGTTTESAEIVTVRAGSPTVLVVPLMFMGQNGDDPSWHVVFCRRHLLGQSGTSWTLPRGRALPSGVTGEEPPELLANRVLADAFGRHYVESACGNEILDLGKVLVGGEIQPGRVLAFRSLIGQKFDRGKLDGEVLFATWHSVKVMVSRNYLSESDVAAALFKCECAELT